MKNYQRELKDFPVKIGRVVYSSSKLLQAILKCTVRRVKPTKVLKRPFVVNYFRLLNMQDSFISSIF